MYPKCMLGHFLSSSVRETGTPMGTKRQNNVHNIEITLDERLNNVTCQLGLIFQLKMSRTFGEDLTKDLSTENVSSCRLQCPLYKLL